MRASIYARYSTDRQSLTSIDDQVRVCSARAAREGWEVVACHSDSATSGSIEVGARPGGNALLRDAMAGRFDVLLLEGLDRLSRDQVEQERIVRRLEHRGIRIVGIADGYDSAHSGRKIMRGVRGLINELYLDDLRHKTQRGMHGPVDRGYMAGGKCYGYDIVRADDGSRYQVNEEQARWVRWIFQEIAAGRTLRTVVYELNARGVPSPRGGTWAVSAIYGSPIKGTGILNNELYVGRYIWNRSQWIKDPDTAKRQRVERPRNEWRVVEVPELRIVASEIWRRVRLRIDGGRGADGRKEQHRPAGTLLGGLMFCPHCRGPLVAVNNVQYGCNVRRDRGPAVCQGFYIRRDVAEKRILSVVRNELLSPAAAAVFEQEFRAAVEQAVSEQAGDAASLRARAKLLEQEIGRLIDAIASVGASDALAARLRASEREYRELKDQLLEQAEAVAVPDVRSIFQQLLLRLNEALAKDAPQARTALLDILQRVDIELRGEGAAQEVWAQMKTTPALQLAAGAVFNSGSGGQI
jgi:site-specific DNA recombinase